MGIDTVPRREREKTRQRQEILSAACDLFSESGYHKVSMHEIADKAEFAVGTLYKFFRNKEELYKALVLEQYDRLESAIKQAIEGQDNEVVRLRNYFRVKGEGFQQNLPLIRLLVAERTGASFNLKAGLHQEMRKRHYAFLERLASLVGGAIKKKQFKEIVDPFCLAVALDSALDALLLLRLDMPEHHPDPDLSETILEVFLNGLMNPVRL